MLEGNTLHVTLIIVDKTSACAISCLGYNSNSAMRDKQIKTILKVIPKSAVLSPGITFSVTTAGLEDYT